MKRARKPVYFIFCEGTSNKTEITYLSHFRCIDSSYSMTMKPTSNTNPEAMLTYAVSYSRRQGFDERSGDKIFLLCDIDTKEKRKRLLDANIIEKAKRKHATILFSNPSFEIWFLNHFRKTTKIYQNQNEVIQDLRHFIPDYEKNKDVFKILNDNMELAIQNSRIQLHSTFCIEQENAGTDIFVLIELLIKNIILHKEKDK